MSKKATASDAKAVLGGANAWLPNRGRRTKLPFAKGALIDVKRRNGDVDYGLSCGKHDLKTSLSYWRFGNGAPDNPLDILEYRESGPVDKPVRASDQDGCGAGVSVDPIAWRNRIREINKAIDSLREEREALVSLLSAEGFVLADERSAISIKAGILRPDDIPDAFTKLIRYAAEAAE